MTHALITLAFIIFGPPALAATPAEANLTLEQSHQKMVDLVDRMAREGSLTAVERTLVLGDLSAHVGRYKEYVQSVTMAHTYLKKKTEREHHYVQKILHMSSRLDNFSTHPFGDLSDITEELTDYVPADRKCGVPVVMECVAREVEVRQDAIYQNISQRNARVRRKFKKAADQGLHTAEIYARVLATLRSDNPTDYLKEYIYGKDRLVIGVKQEIEVGY